MRLGRLALCEKIGVNEQCVMKWERGTNQPLLGNLIAWAGALGLELRIGPKTDTRKSQPEDS